MRTPRGARRFTPLLAAFLLSASQLTMPGCAARSSDPDPALTPAPTTEPAVATPMTPTPARSYVDGAPLTDDAALLAWLEASEGKALRLPVAITFDDEYRLAIQTARVGGVALKLDDTAMGVAVLDQVKGVCPDGAPGCTVWLEGTWGSVLPGASMPGLPGPGGPTGPSLGGPSLPGGPGLAGPSVPAAPGPKRHPFAVRKVGGLADGAPSAAQIEG
jgi:hypothetical protein